MPQLVILKLGQGNWQQGFPVVIAQLWEEHSAVPVQFTGDLPPSVDLPSLYQQWRSLYKALTHRVVRQSSSFAIELDDEDEVTNVSMPRFEQLSQQLSQAFNHWLDAGSFRKVERQLRTHLVLSSEIRVVIETEDPQVRRFPWHVWTFFEDYPQAEVALSTPEYGRSPVDRSPTGKVRILAILGNSTGIDVQADRALLQQLPQADVVFLPEPQRRELDALLWDDRGWDILFFAGHSSSQADASSGEFALNPSDSITIPQLRNALKAAISRGLKLAILNSCDGLGLARSMADLNIPQLVVMREPVPDRVAQDFLKYLLQAFSGGKSFYRSVREAREKLQGLEDQFPCASWLPVICQNPAEPSPTWPSLVGVAPEPIVQPAPDPAPQEIGRSPRGAGFKRGLLASVAVTGLMMGLRFLGVLQSVELSAYDQLMRSRPAESPDPRLLVVKVDETATDEYGYPLEDQTLTRLIQTLIALKPRAIGLDMHRSVPRGTPAERQAFLEQFRQYPNVLLVCSFGSRERNFAPPPQFSEEQRLNQVGFSDLMVDIQPTADHPSRDDLVGAGELINPSNAVRRQLLSYDPKLSGTPSACITPYSFSLQLASHFLAAAQVPIVVNANQEWQFGQVAFQRLSDRFGGYQDLNGQMSQVMLNYRSGVPAAMVTLKEVLDGRVSRDWVENRVILVGLTSKVARDTLNTPAGEMPGVWIHAHMVSQILSAAIDQRPLIWVLPQMGGLQWGDALWVGFWSLLGGLLAWRMRSFLWLVGLAIVATVILYSLCLMLLVRGGWLPLIPSALGLWLTSSVTFVLKTSPRLRSVPSSQ